MRTAKKRPLLNVRAHYDGKQPFVEAYADVFAQFLRSQRKAKSSIHTFDTGKQFHYDLGRIEKERDHNGKCD